MIKKFLKENIVLCIAILLAVITMFIIPPNKEYLKYFDMKTLTCLFITLSVVCALKSVNFFSILAQKIVFLFKSSRNCIIALLLITFIGSMFIANDMALITFLPLGYYILKSTNQEKYVIHTFILQNIAANLGGMLTPFGNPQNLYLYSKFNIPTAEFFFIMFLPFAVSMLLIILCCFIFIKNEPLEITFKMPQKDIKKTIIYLILFFFTLLVVFRVIHYLIGLIVVSVVLFIFNKKIFLKVDYGLLLTFFFFFIFSSNLSKMPIVQDFLSKLLNKSTLLISIASCQIISNVPTAILLSNFTGNYKELLLGVNIGGVGTLISSLASLITFKEFCHHYPNQQKKYLLTFSLLNFSFLIILVVVVML